MKRHRTRNVSARLIYVLFLFYVWLSCLLEIRREQCCCKLFSYTTYLSSYFDCLQTLVCVLTSLLQFPEDISTKIGKMWSVRIELRFYSYTWKNNVMTLNGAVILGLINVDKITHLSRSVQHCLPKITRGNFRHLKVILLDIYLTHQIV